MQSFIGKRCLFCNQEVQVTDGVYICPDCGGVYHRTCWEKSGGCLTPGCSEHTVLPTKEILQAEQVFQNDIPKEKTVPNATSPLFCEKNVSAFVFLQSSPILSYCQLHISLLFTICFNIFCFNIFCFFQKSHHN